MGLIAANSTYVIIKVGSLLFSKHISTDFTFQHRAKMKRARGAEPTTDSNKKSKEVVDEERELNESFLVERHNLLNQINVPSPPSFNDVNAGANTIKSSDDSPPAKDLMSFNTDVSELPLPPPPLLQEQDFLTQINVHCQCEAGVNSFFKGFTFVYNSKAEITVGKVRGTTESACKLEHGEHIVHFDCTDGNSAFIFHTTNGRRWYIHCNKQTFVDGSPKGVWLPSTNVLLTTPDRHGNPILSEDWPSAFQRRGRAPVGHKIMSTSVKKESSSQTKTSVSSFGFIST